jgi:hypothetical protein
VRSCWWTLRSNSAALVAALIGLTTTAASAEQAPRGYVGIQGLLLVGVHHDIGGVQRGFAPAALLEVRGGGRRFGLHIEGIPVISAPQRATAFYGQSTPAVGIVNGVMTYAVDRYFTIGVGTTIVNQRTPLPNLLQVSSSRLAGGRLELLYRKSFARERFLEAGVGIAPRLFGIVHFIYSDGSPAVNKDERAREFDASFAVGRRFAYSELLVGLRSLNFSGRFTRTGAESDRNDGIGVTVEWRRLFR